MHAFGITLGTTTVALFLLCMLVPQYASAYEAHSAQDVCFWDYVEGVSLCSDPSLHIADNDIDDASATFSEHEAPTERVIGLPSWGSMFAAANEAVKEAGDGLSTFASEFDVNEAVKTAGKSFSTITSEFDVKRRIQELESTINDILAVFAEIRGHMAELTQKGLTMDNISDELEGIFKDISVYVEETFPSPDQALSHKERLMRTRTILDRIIQAILDFLRKHGMSEDALERVRRAFASLKRLIEKLVGIIGDFIERHPFIFRTLISSMVGKLFPGSWIIRLLLTVMGFGQYGPIKGSPATWAQSQFWGAAVKKGSWFAILQKAGMGGGFF
ncbi:hypothetical protein BJ322DRAFT_1073982 [Thelephora terrestris]|uniref:Uncharacterized protein n=1 Tax=Thelephora terrestris TaxID=56493 RepID=A0A9P6HDL5_9AGAM|nr:hypothetical protein BJ322DRAFT_1073982 [Thelephora terrestris]